MLAASVALASIAAHVPDAQAQGATGMTFRCTGTDGKRYYGSTVPQACYGRPVEQLNRQGMVVRRIDPEGDEKQRAAKEAEAVSKRQRETAARESSRRDRALLATYSSEKEIEAQRLRALAENQRAVKDVEERIQDIKKRQVAYDRELAFYPAPQNPPQKLLQDIKAADGDLEAQLGLLAMKKKEVEQINAKYGEEKRRFTQLTKRR
jgi:hypothetical protein